MSWRSCSRPAGTRASRSSARREVVSKYIAETEQNLASSFEDVERGGTLLVLDEADGLLGKRDEIERHDGPVVLGVRSIASIPVELRKNLVVVKAPRRRSWR